MENENDDVLTSDDEDLRAALREAIAEDAASQSDQNTVKEFDPPRDEQGRFAHKEAPALSDQKPVAEPEKPVTPTPEKPVTPQIDQKTAPVAEQKAATSEQPQQQQPASTPQPSPVSWSQEAKQAWNNLPPAVQAAVIKREQEVSSGFRQISEVIAPVRQLAKENRVSEQEVIQRFYNAERNLQNAPAQSLMTLALTYGADYGIKSPQDAILWLAHTHQIDLDHLALNAAPERTAAFDHAHNFRAAVQPYQEQFATLQAENQAIKSQFERFQEQQRLDVVNQFAANAPYLDQLTTELQGLIPMYLAQHPDWTQQQVLQAAYDAAVKINPTVNERIMAEKQEAERQRAAAAAAKAEAERVAQAKRAAAISPQSGGPGTATKPNTGKYNPQGDVMDDLRAVMEELRSV